MSFEQVTFAFSVPAIDPRLDLGLLRRCVLGRSEALVLPSSG
jgi:hypothetical protein